MPTRRALTTRGLDLELAFDDVPDLVLGVVAAVKRRLPRRPAFTDDFPRRPSSK
jgi:hypothetical protein